MHWNLTLALCILVVSVKGFSTLASFPDYRFGVTTLNIPVPTTIQAGTGILLEVKALGDLNQDGPEYVSMNIDGTVWVWLDENDTNDPFLTYSPYGLSEPDYGLSYVVMRGEYVVPHALAQTWISDGYIQITASWGSETSYLVGGDYFSVSVTFNPGSVVGDPHVQPLYSDAFELNGDGIFNYYTDEQLTINGRSTQPYHGYTVTEVAVIFDNHEDTQWVLHAAIDEHYIPRVYFNDIEILPGTFLLDGNLRFTENVKTLDHIAGQLNEGYLRSVVHLDVPGSGFFILRVGVDELAGGYFELVFSPTEHGERSTRGGMLMMTSEESRDIDVTTRFTVDDIFAIPALQM